MIGGLLDEELTRYRADQAHAYLERIRRMGEDCAGLRQMVDDARDRASGLKGIDYSAVRVSSSSDGDQMVNAVEFIRAAICDYVETLRAYEGERHRAADALDDMDDATEAKALRLRYLLGWEWEAVCVDMHYSWQGMMSLRRRALASYWEVMPHEWRDPMQSAI